MYLGYVTPSTWARINMSPGFVFMSLIRLIYFLLLIRRGSRSSQQIPGKIEIILIT